MKTDIFKLKLCGKGATTRHGKPCMLSSGAHLIKTTKDVIVYVQQSSERFSDAVPVA